MGRSRVLEFHAQRLKSQESSYLKQHIWLHKDMKILLEEANVTGSSLPLSAQAQQILMAARDLKAGEETIGLLLAFYESVV